MTPGDPSCSNGQALVPKGISMSSKKKNRLGPDKCEDGNVDTVCTTKSEPYPTIILDFGQPVDIAQVRLYTILYYIIGLSNPYPMDLSLGKNIMAAD